jgi:TRAP-type transport system periplasmic protein
VTAARTYATHNRALNLAGMPFLVDSYEQGWKYYDESKWEAGFRSFTTRALLASPADAKGVKMRP